MLYKLYFKDGTMFEGGYTIEDSKWADVPDKEILRLEYRLSDETSLVLQNFEKYAAFTETIKQLTSTMGDCPKCNKTAKLSRLKYAVDGKKSSKIVARCSDNKCKWIGKVKDLKNTNTSFKPCPQYKYIAGLKNNIVTSYRIALEGKKGTDKYEKGDVTKRNYPKGKEYKGKPVADWVWKKGSK